MSGADTRARLTADIYIALVCTLFGTLLPTSIMAGSFVLIGGWIVAETRDLPLLVLAVLAASAAAVRILVLLTYRGEAARGALTAVRAGQLERRFAAPYLAFALFFGLFAARAFAIGSADARLLLVGLLFGYGAGVAAGISLRPWICVPSVLVAIGPTIVTSLFLPGPGNWGVGLLTALFLAGGIESMLRRYQASSRQFALQQLLSSVDRRDELTGLANPLALRERFTQVTASTAGAEMIAMLWLRIDGIEAINGSHGYPAGDALLKAVARRLSRLTGQDEFAARMPGAAFAIVQQNILQPRRADILASDIATAVSKPYLIGGDSLCVAAHIGYASDVQQGADFARLLHDAGEASQQAHREARDVVGHSQPRWSGDVQIRRKPGPNRG